VSYVVAGVVAACALLMEQHWQQRLWFTVQASGWWTFRLLAEATWGVALTATLLHLPKHVLSINGIVLGVVAGLAAPRLLGQKELQIKGHNLSLFNLAYRRVTERADDMIDSNSAEAQRRYLGAVVRPAVLRGDLPLGSVVDAFREHIKGRRGMTDAERTTKLLRIDKVEKDETATEEDMVCSLVLQAWQIGAYGALQNLMKELPRRKYGTRVAVGNLLRRFRFGRWILARRAVRLTAAESEND
jgi:hypothetical protein